MAPSLVSQLTGRAAPWIVLAAIICCSALPLSVVQAEDTPTLADAIISPAPAPLLGVPTPAPAPKPLILHDKVVAALRAAGHYGAISGLLDSLGESAIIKPGITLFAPDDAAFNGLNMNSSLLLTTTLDYHVSTTVYTYQDLSNLPVNSTLQTAAPNVFIFITSTGANALRLDDVAICPNKLETCFSSTVLKPDEPSFPNHALFPQGGCKPQQEQFPKFGTQKEVVRICHLL